MFFPCVFFFPIIDEYSGFHVPKVSGDPESTMTGATLDLTTRNASGAVPTVRDSIADHKLDIPVIMLIVAFLVS